MKSKTTRKKTITAKKMCSRVIQREGVKANGTLKKGYKYAKGGRVVKAKAPVKNTAQRGLGKVYTGGGTKTCRRINENGSTTTYNSFGGSRPCPYGGNEISLVEVKASLRGAAKKSVKPKFNQSIIDNIAGKLLNSGLTASSMTIAKAKAKIKNVASPVYVGYMIETYSKDIKKAMVTIRKQTAALKKKTAKKKVAKKK